MIEVSSLESLSRKLVQRLLQTYPEWEQFVEISGGDEGEKTVTFKVPQPESDRFLWISTAEMGEVTIAFGMWHTHEGSWLEDTDENADAKIVDRSLELIGSILRDEVIVIVEICKGVWMGSGCQGADQEVGEVRPGHQISVYSWLKSHDRVLQG